MAKKILIQPNPNLRPTVSFERVTDRGVEGQPDRVTNEENLTRAPGTKFQFMVPLSRSTGRLATGLEFEVENPYKDSDNYRTTEWESLLKDKEKITKQTELEYKHGHTPGYYSSKAVTNIHHNFKNRTDEIPYFYRAESALDLKDGLTVLDLGIPREEVLYHNLRAADMVANNFEEMNPSTLFYIAKEDEEQIQKQKRARRQNSALAKLEELMSQKDNSVIDFCKVVGGDPSRRANLSEVQAYDILDEFIKKNPQQLEQFERIHTMFSKDKEKFAVRVLLWNYLQSRVIKNTGTNFNWQPPVGEDGIMPPLVEWSRREDVLEFLSDDKNSKDHDLLEKQYIAYTRI